MKNITIIIIIIFITIIAPSAKAAESTPSSSIKSKLEELKKEIASKAAILKTEINRKLKDKAYTGKITTKSQTSLTLATKSGPKIVNINKDTLFTKGLRTLAEDDLVAALGDVDETGVLTARKIVLIPQPAAQKTYLRGQIVSVSNKLVTLKSKNLKNIAVSGVSQKVKINNFVIITGSKKGEVFEADFVYAIPQGGILKTKTATSSAQKKIN